MTRTTRLIKQINKGSKEKSIDGKTALEQIEVTRNEILPLIEQHAECWNNEIQPKLVKEGINIQKFGDLPDKAKESARSSLLPTKIVLKARTCDG